MKGKELPTGMMCIFFKSKCWQKQGLEGKAHWKQKLPIFLAWSEWESAVQHHYGGLAATWLMDNLEKDKAILRDTVGKAPSRNWKPLLKITGMWSIEETAEKYRN